jgi:hypothetical protein|tara:strand:+ start:12435 stop:12848 length:414 start_codon:yes stop_codon:yes gene_type:complete
MEYDGERKKIEIHKKFFFDDLEQTIKDTFLDENFDIINSQEYIANNYIEKYLKDNIEFFVNDKKQDFNYLGYEYEDGMVHCYFEVTKIKKIKKIKIKDTSLFNTFEGQENLIYFQLDQKLTTIRLKQPKLFDTIIFK